MNTVHTYRLDMLHYVLQVNIYRFSISWARILPNGDDKIQNIQGLQYYKDLISELKSASIEPMVTLYHMDLPQSLEDHGGWLNEDIIDNFADYARICFRELGPLGV